MAARLTTCAAAVLSLVIAGCGGSSQSAATSASSRPPLESIFEAETQLHANPAGTLDLLRRLGADRVKVFVAWNKLAPDPQSSSMPSWFNAADPAAYPAGAWSIYDTVVRDAAARKMPLDITIGGPPPLWAAGPGRPPGKPHPQWMPSAADFGAFVRAIATRYSGSYHPAGASSSLPRVDFWSIWNEPNYGPYLAPQSTDNSTVEVSPSLYRGLVDAAWSSLQSTGHGGDTILIGELAPRGMTLGNSPGTFGGMVPLRFLRALYCVDSSYRELQGAAAAARGCPTTTAASTQFVSSNPALFHASGFALHPYPQSQPPNVGTPDEPDYADLPQLPIVEHELDQLQQAYGSSTRFAIYSTEFGYKTDPPGPLSPPPPTAAYYLNWAEYITWRDPRIRSYDQYQLMDPPTGVFPTGLLFANGAPKPSYDAYRMPLYLPVTTAPQAQSLEVWGAVRPSYWARLATGKSQQVQIQFQPLSRGPFQTIKTITLGDRNGYFDVNLYLDRSGTLRTRWSYPGGPAISSRTAIITIR